MQRSLHKPTRPGFGELPGGTRGDLRRVAHLEEVRQLHALPYTLPCAHESQHMPKGLDCDGKAREIPKKHPEWPHKTRVFIGTQAQGVQEQCWGEAAHHYHGHRRNCFYGQGAGTVCTRGEGTEPTCQGRAQSLCALPEEIILVWPAPQGTKAWSAGSASQGDAAIDKAGLGVASPRPSTYLRPSIRPKEGALQNADKRLKACSVPTRAQYAFTCLFLSYILL